MGAVTSHSRPYLAWLCCLSCSLCRFTGGDSQKEKAEGCSYSTEGEWCLLVDPEGGRTCRRDDLACCVDALQNCRYINNVVTFSRREEAFFMGQRGSKYYLHRYLHHRGNDYLIYYFLLRYYFLGFGMTSVSWSVLGDHDFHVGAISQNCRGLQYREQSRSLVCACARAVGGACDHRMIPHTPGSKRQQLFQRTIIDIVAPAHYIKCQIARYPR